jgi:Zn-dependent protease
MVSIAGILANLLIATIAFVLYKAVLFTRLGQAIPLSFKEPVDLFLVRMLLMNVSLAIFNLLPFPPLDGSKILETFLPPSMQPVLETLERYGFLIFIVLMYLGFFDAIFRPVIRIIQYLLYM